MRSSALRWSLAVSLLVLAAHARAAIVPCSSAGIVRYVPCEVTGTLSNPTSNSYKDRVVWADFTNPGRAPVRVYGVLYAGNADYRFRFTPTLEGTWSYTFGSTTGSTISPASGSFNVGYGREYGFLRRDSAPGLPERITYDCAYDGEQCPTEGSPFASGAGGFSHPFLWGQTYYQIINNAATKNGATPNLSWQTAVTSAKAKGFRKIRMLVFPFNGDYNGAYRINGSVPIPAPQSLPYMTSGGLCSPNYEQINLAHFLTLDTIVNFMHTQKMVAELILFHDQDPGAHCGSSYSTTANRLADDQRYAKYVVARYAAYPNVIFSMGNEWEIGPYNVTDFNALAESTKPYDPFRLNPDNNNLLRLFSVHGHERVTPTPGLNIATSPTTGWLVHSSLQWSSFAPPADRSNQPPDGWGEEIRLANPDRPSIDDEFGYLHNFDGPDPNNPDPASRLKHRQAMWGLALAGVYGSVGDTRKFLDPNGKDVDLTMRSDWLNRPEWNDYFYMARFFTDQAAQHPLVASWLLRRDTSIYNNPSRRAWLASNPNLYLVLYDALGNKATSNVSFNLPPWPDIVFDIYTYNPTTGAYSALRQTLPPGALFTYNRNEFTTDIVFLFKARPTSSGG